MILQSRAGIFMNDPEKQAPGSELCSVSSQAKLQYLPVKLSGVEVLSTTKFKQWRKI